MAKNKTSLKTPPTRKIKGLQAHELADLLMSNYIKWAHKPKDTKYYLRVCKLKAVDSCP